MFSWQWKKSHVICIAWLKVVTTIKIPKQTKGAQHRDTE